MISRNLFYLKQVSSASMQDGDFTAAAEGNAIGLDMMAGGTIHLMLARTWFFGLM